MFCKYLVYKGCCGGVSSRLPSWEGFTFCSWCTAPGGPAVSLSPASACGPPPESAPEAAQNSGDPVVRKGCGGISSWSCWSPSGGEGLRGSWQPCERAGPSQSRLDPPLGGAADCLRGRPQMAPPLLASLNNDASSSVFPHEHSRLWISLLLSPQTISYN